MRTPLPVICFLAYLSLYAISTRAQSPAAAVNFMKQHYQLEKLYFHYDKESYVAGEQIWFKAYLMEGFFPDTTSTTLYISLIDASQKVISKKTLPVVGSCAIGNFALDKNLKQGRYTILAYTRKMMSFGPAFFYHHEFSIYDPTITLPQAEENRIVSLNFFPEGGTFIADVKNTLAFKAADQYGNPVKVTGELKNKAGEIVADLLEVHDGMGKFSLTPARGEVYTAYVKYAGGQELVQEKLPVCELAGSTLQIARGDAFSYFQVNNEKALNAEMFPAYMMGVVNNEVVFKNLLPATSLVQGKIPTGALPSGILQVTLFTAKDQPLAERLIFIDNGDYQKQGLFKSDVLSLAPHAKNEYQYSFADSTTGSFSVSVVNANDEIAIQKRNSIISSMLLTEELRGIVFQPDYYFTQANSNAKAALDLVMLTNGWRRYNWQQMLTNQLPPVYDKHDNYISMSGYAYDAATNKRVINTELSGTISKGDSTLGMITIPVDGNGNISLDGLMFEDSVIILYRDYKNKNGTTYINQNTPKISAYNTFNVANYGFQKSTLLPLPEQLQQKLQSNYVFYNDPNSPKAVLLDNIQLEVAKPIDKTALTEKKYVTNGVFGGGATTLDFINEPLKNNLSTNVLDYIKSRINGVSVTGRPPDYFINYRSTRSLMGGPLPMNIFLDEQQVDVSAIAYLKMAEIAMIKVYSQGFAGAAGGGAGGTLAVFTRRGEDRLVSGAKPGMSRLKMEGYSPTKEFYSPNYANGKPVEKDLRTTLYWNPYLVTDGVQNKLSIPFYNTDNATKLKVVIVGFTAEGKLVDFEKIIE